MQDEQQHTVARTVSLGGIGVHSGAPATLTFAPGPVDSGIVFERSKGFVRAHIAQVSDARLGTTLAGATGVQVLTVEHVLAACFGLGFDNLRVSLDGPEAPIMDGSSLAYAQALAQAGRAPQEAPRRCLELLAPVEVREGDKHIALAPSDGFDGLALDVTIAFADPAIGEQRLALELTPDRFMADIAPARTFGFLSDLAPLRASGRALGSSYENTVVIDQGRVLNAEGLRFPDEFVRHKALDLIGDLALLGAPLRARCTAFKPGHALSAALMRALLAQPQAWRLV